MKRKIIKIDESKCNGCGECIPNCKEGALKIVNGKARLVSDVFCDGLGACLGHCPQDAITIEERDAPAFDERAAHVHAHAQGACPGSKVMDLVQSTLFNWPIQIRLIPAIAPFLQGADLLIAADCVGFSAPDFHQSLLPGKVLLVGCPKLDDIQQYRDKISQIVKVNDIKSITCAHMEVPCCTGLISVIKDAIAASGKKIPLKDINVGINGKQL